MNRSIREKIIFTYVFVFSITLALLNLLVFKGSETMIINERKNVLRERRTLFLEHIERRIKAGSTLEESITTGIDEFNTLDRIYSVSIKTSTGIEINNRPPELKLEFENLESGIFEEGEDGLEDIKEHLVIGETGEEYLVDGLDGEEYIVLNDQLTIKDGTVYQLQYILKGDYDNYLKDLIELLVIVELIGLIVAILIGIKIAKNVTDPLLKICDLTEKIDSNNLTGRVPNVSTDIETERLINLINSMLERLEKSFNTQKTFISNVSHELRTPISVIKGYLDLKNTMKDMPPALVDEAFTIIEEENKYMKEIIEKLLFLAKEEVNSIELNQEVVSVKEMLKRLKKNYEVVNDDIKISLDVDEDVLLNCDVNLVRQMMRGLIDNAIKYSGNGGIVLEGKKSPEFIEISVEDFGTGISKEDLEKIFDRFYRGDKARTRESSGAGLGLSIVERIAKLHKCKIDVKSEVGKGSKFILHFPREDR